MNVSEYWKALTAAALLGTERQEPPSAAPTPLAPALPEGAGREEALLDAAAAAALYRRSGRVPPASPHPLPPAAPPDAWTEPTAEQHRCFEAVMHAGSPKGDLAGELLGLMARARVRPVRGWLFRVLEEAHERPELRPAALEVVGERGRWLARFVPFGQWVTPEDPGEALWEEGRLEERLAYLARVRQADPARARALLEAAWAQEPHDARARMLQELEANLSLDDEPFLEACLDDRRKEVRGVAQELLSRLPGSRLVQRMAERARPLLRFTPAGMLGLKQARLEVVLPEQFEKAWARDGVEQKGAPYGMGEKAWWLAQILGRVPPSAWGDPEAVLPAVKADKEWRELLEQALAEAAVRFRDEAWALALLEGARHVPSADLLAALSPRSVLAQALRRLGSGSGPLGAESLEWQLLTRCPRPYPPELLEALGKRATVSLLNWQKMQKNDWRTQHFLPELALHLDPAFAPALHPSVRQAFANPDHPLFEAFSRFTGLLEFRHEMHQAFVPQGV